jgi:hypothetical protein
MKKGHVMRMDSIALIFGSVVLSSTSQLILKRGMTTEGVQSALKSLALKNSRLYVSWLPQEYCKREKR